MNTSNKLFYQKYSLKNGLEQYVKYAWVMKSYESQSQQDLLIPDGYPEIIFVQKGAYKKAFLHPNQPSIIINQSCIIGIQTQTVLASRLQQCHLIGLKLYPTGAYALLGNRLKELSDNNQSLSEFGIEWLTTLNKKLQTCQEVPMIIELLSETLENQLAKVKNNPKIKLATTYLNAVLAVNGQINVQALAQQHCLSIRQYQRNFKAFFGISPKKFLNIIRFKHFYKSSILQQKAPKDFLKFGYYDQMHFIKDFQKHLGINPSKSATPSFLQKNKMAQINS